ncbi:dihydrofolate reductase [Sulfitobacter sp.]|uniref:dihydrofolate reductase n=1 Tax=Sulfitobacter sp. TaxID=1903071 RepID=UPI003002F977
MISLIVARAMNGAIGRNGSIPWDVPQDLKFFQRETVGGAIIMGRNTWDSLPFKPLPKRLNIVVSSNPKAAEIVVASVAAAIDHAHGMGISRIYGIGGAQIYQEMLPLADRLLISEVGIEVPNADTFFPDFDAGQWQKICSLSLSDGDPTCALHEYIRRNQSTYR